MSYNNNPQPNPQPVQAPNANGQIMVTSPASTDAEQFTNHQLYGTFANGAPSAAGEVANRLTVFGRWVHGFPVDINIREDYEPTHQRWNGAGVKFKDVKGNPPRGLNGQPLSNHEWDRAFNRADSEIRDWYDKDQLFRKEEANQLRKEDRALGITRAHAILMLKEKGVLAGEYVDDAANH